MPHTDIPADVMSQASDFDPDLHEALTRVRAQIDGYQQSALVYLAVKLGLADVLAETQGDAESLATRLGLQTGPLQRVLRALESLGYVHGESDGTYSLTLAGRLLTEGHPATQRHKAILAVEQYWAAWGELSYTLRTGKPAFEHLHGLGPWAYRRRHPELEACFEAWLAAETRGAAAVLTAALDLAGNDIVADIAGGKGALLVHLLQANPSLAGVLFEQPGVAEGARSLLDAAALGTRARVVEGDFFAGIPVAADVYLLKSVIHDWEDPEAVKILQNCRRAMPDHAHLFLVERVLPEAGRYSQEIAMLDIRMLAITGGRERTLAEYFALLDATGFAVDCVRETSIGYTILKARGT